MTPNELGTEGLRRAWQRWRVIDGSADDVAMVDGSVTATEMVMWVVALHDFASQDGDAFGERDEELLRSLRWARNRGVHGLIDLVEPGDGAVYPAIYPRRYRHFAWTPLEQIQDARARPDQIKWEPLYRARLAGEPVRRTIYDAAQILGVDL